MKLQKITGSHAGRIVLVAIPVAVVGTLTMGSVANGSVPVSFSISGQQFHLSATSLDGKDFSQYAGVVKDTGGTERQVAIANIGSASLTDLCQSVSAGNVGVMITAGGGDKPVTATDLQIGMTDLKGDASFSNIRIGVDASTVNTEAKGSAGDFAQDADAITIKGLQQTAWSTSAGVFNLNGMHVQITDGSKDCF
jgi:hypothetical protein